MLHHIFGVQNSDPNLHYNFMQVKFFHKVGSLPVPVTDSQKLIWGVLEAERPAFRCYVIFFPFLSFFNVVIALRQYDIHLAFFTLVVNCMRNLFWRQIDHSLRNIKVNYLLHQVYILFVHSCYVLTLTSVAFGFLMQIL